MTQVNSSHAKSRNKELLACARTAYKLMIQNDESKSIDQKPVTLSLWKYPKFAPVTDIQESLEDANVAMQATERAVMKLDGLVRRRGHTNDPTEQINSCMIEFKACMEELMESAKSIRKIPSTKSRNHQRKKHFEVIASIIEQRGKDLTERFQSALSVRSDVLKLQAERKKMLVSNATTTASKSTSASGHHNKAAPGNNVNQKQRKSGLISKDFSSTVTANQFHSPLFTMTGANRRASTSNSIVNETLSSTVSQNNGIDKSMTKKSQNKTESKTFSEIAPSYPSSSLQQTGMRRRGGVNANNSVKQKNQSYYKNTSSSYYQAYSQHQQNNYATEQHFDEQKYNQSDKTARMMQDQVQQRRNARDTMSRMDNARQVESAIAELGQMFGKMATLVSQQQEIVDKIDDDVEMSMMKVDAGTQEIQKVFDIVQSNRGLIFKIFGLLIFFILFFKMY